MPPSLLLKSHTTGISDSFLPDRCATTIGQLFRLHAAMVMKLSDQHVSPSGGEGSSGWEQLDRSLSLLILSHLTDPKDIASVQRVNKEMAALGSSEEVWLPLLSQRFGLHLEVRFYVVVGAHA